MRHVMALLPLLLACSSDATPEADAPGDTSWIRLETGRACAQATVACAPGNCAANVDNTCPTPVTCDLHIECICRAFTGEEGPATATAGEQTILAGNKVGLAAKVVCDAGDVLATIARTVHCF